jgi:hypothetical protein
MRFCTLRDLGYNGVLRACRYLEHGVLHILNQNRALKVPAFQSVRYKNMTKNCGNWSHKWSICVLCTSTVCRVPGCLRTVEAGSRAASSSSSSPSSEGAASLPLAAGRGGPAARGGGGGGGNPRWKGGKRGPPPRNPISGSEGLKNEGEGE